MYLLQQPAAQRRRLAKKNLDATISRPGCTREHKERTIFDALNSAFGLLNG
jgi:hypothetical protein